MDDGWTLDELVRRAAQALAADDVRAPNGRVRDLPDGRAVRWYTTIGLVDRPLAARGRVARYGPRHLRQVVAVKRRQAQGRTLAEIQAELAGATDATLAAVARVPAQLLADATEAADNTETTDATGATGAGVPTSTPVESPAGAAVAARGRFWADRPAPVATQEPTPRAGGRTHRPDDSPRPPRVDGYVVALGGGVTLTLPVPPDRDDLAAIADAATDLLTVLAHRGLRVTTPRGD